MTDFWELQFPDVLDVYVLSNELSSTVDWIYHSQGFVPDDIMPWKYNWRVCMHIQEYFSRGFKIGIEIKTIINGSHAHNTNVILRDEQAAFCTFS